MDFYDAINARTSIRNYTDDPVGKQVIKKLIDAARRAPTARAVEPWEFVIIQNKNKLRELSEVAPNGSFISQAGAAIIVFCRQTKYYLEDGCAATENILLAAAAEKLGACWIAGDKKEYCSQIKAIFKAPADMMLISIIALGHNAEDKKQNKNRPIEDMIHWESF